MEEEKDLTKFRLNDNPYYKGSCRHSNEVQCTYEKRCEFLSPVECLQFQLVELRKEHLWLKKKRAIKHDELSKRWRDSSFYLKKRHKTLLQWLAKNGIKYPNMVQMEIELSKERG